jgi:uncharacterized protein GlcG (DUF336 family)
MYTKNTPQVTLEGANIAIRAVLQEATRRGAELSVAVVDAGGHLVALARTDGAEIQTVQIAERKARNAAFTGVPTGPKSKAGNVGSDHHLLAITLAAGVENVVTVQGGLPLIIDGKCVGGIAVSGAAHADSEIAAVGVGAIAGP